MADAKNNIILITVDSLRADRLSCYGYPKPTSPNIDLFARQAERYTHAFSHGPNTPHAFPAIMASCSALASNRLGLFDAPVTLAEVLRNAGYTTAGFNAANPYVSRYFAYDRGFDDFHDYLNFDLPSSGFVVKSFPKRDSSALISIPGLNMERYLVTENNIRGKAELESTINNEIFSVIKSIKGQPFFLWIHYMDTHYPYLPQMQPQSELAMQVISKEENFNLNVRVRENMDMSADLLNKVNLLYDASVRQVDFKIGELVQFLEGEDLYDSSLVIFTADHGEEFREHGDLQHKSKLYDELIHVPLLIKKPFQADGLVCNEMISLMRLPATILSVVKIDNPFPCTSFVEEAKFDNSPGTAFIFSTASYGKNNASPVERDMFRLARMPKIYACRTKGWKLIAKSSGEKLLFNLVKDPGERVNISDSDFAKQNALDSILTDYKNYLERLQIRSQIRRLHKIFVNGGLNKRGTDDKM